ncbi:MAG TPA: hypothetical protein VF928_14640 [Usitatibacteraceae bacterium]
MRRTGLLCFFVLVLAGCATAPAAPVPSFALPAGSKVGILVALDRAPVHVHVGTTVFNNFSKSYSFPWDINEKATSTFSAQLKAASFVLIELASVGFKANEINALVTSDGRAWLDNPAQLAQLDRLRKELDVKAVVVVADKRVLADLECSGGPCAERYMDKSGLFTRSFLGLTRYKAVAAMEVKIFVLNPAVELSAAEPLKAKLEQRAVFMRDFKEPKVFANLTPEEFAPVANMIDGYLNGAAAAAATTLREGAK